jgi:hypothetical protein
MRKGLPTLIAVAALASGSTPAVAAPGGTPGSLCAIGADNAHAAIADESGFGTGPGASEVARLNPVEFGCTGVQP